MKFRGKPKVIEAVRVTAADFNGHDWDGLPFSEVPEWLGAAIREGKVTIARSGADYAEWDIHTLEGVMRATAGDWIICGIQGELYPCRPDIFVKSYEPVEEPLLLTPEMAKAAIDHFENQPLPKVS